MNRAKKFCAVIFSLVFIVAFNPPLPVSAADGTTVVYVTKTGEKYHTDGCKYLKKSKIEKGLEMRLLRDMSLAASVIRRSCRIEYVI